MDINFERYIEALNASSQRSRSLHLSLIFSFILAITALLNSLPANQNWYKSRIAVRATAREWFIFESDSTQWRPGFGMLENIRNAPKLDTAAVRRLLDSGMPWQAGFTTLAVFAEKLEASAEGPKISPEELKKICADASEAHMWFLPFFDDWNLIKPGGLSKNPPDMPYWARIKPIPAGLHIDSSARAALYGSLCRSIIYLEGSHIHKPSELDTELGYLLRNQTENLSVLRIPILGVAFDVNYLGGLSGAVFLTLVTLLYFSLVREHRNLKILFDKWHAIHPDFTEAGQLYELLSMYQVLTIPLKIHVPNSPGDLVTRRMVIGIFLLPVVAMMLILGYDIHTAKVGASLNPHMTTVTTWVTFIGLLCVAFAAIKALQRQYRIDNLWDIHVYAINLANIIEKGGTTDTTEARHYKACWEETVAQIKQRKKRLHKAAANHYLRKFVHNCIAPETARREMNEFPHWEVLEKWYAEHQQMLTKRGLGDKITEFLNSLKKDK